MGRKKFRAFLKEETVLCIAALLAVISAFWVPPDKEYAGYIDFRTLAVLFCLMSVMAGLQKIGVFGWIAHGLLRRVKSSRSLILLLTLLCFFFSMAITNDVALITFVPFTFTVLDMLGKDVRKRLVLPVVVMQTIAANLGSMLTPIGNPQNLYLYGKAGLSTGAFLGLMLPYTLLSLALLAGWGLLLAGRIPAASCPDEGASDGRQLRNPLWAARYHLAVYLALFSLCLLSVGHVLAWQIVLGIVLVVVGIMDRQVLASVDYALLLTFAAFFVFIGNMGRLPVFCGFLEKMLAGREVCTAVAASQLISNVPAALLLSGFTQDYESLIIGTNLGGLGTLIASMASLISYKYVAKEEGDRKGAYVRLFTAANICFLLLLAGAYILLNEV